MKASDLVFIGIKGSVVALNRATGEQVWATHLKGWDFVNVVLEDRRLLATTHGEVFCLDPLTGQGLWQNPLKGFGTGLSTIATEVHPAGGSGAVLAEEHGQQQQAAAASSAVC